MRQPEASAKLTPIRIAEAPLVCPEIRAPTAGRLSVPPTGACAPGQSEQTRPDVDAEASEVVGTRVCVPREATRSAKVDMQVDRVETGRNEARMKRNRS